MCYFIIDNKSSSVPELVKSNVVLSLLFAEKMDVMKVEMFQCELEGDVIHPEKQSFIKKLFTYKKNW